MEGKADRRHEVACFSDGAFAHLQPAHKERHTTRPPGMSPRYFLLDLSRGKWAENLHRTAIPEYTRVHRHDSLSWHIVTQSLCCRWRRASAGLLVLLASLSSSDKSAGFGVTLRDEVDPAHKTNALAE